MILVTGASGFIGLSLVKALASEGDEPVRGIARSQAGVEAIQAAGAEGVLADVLDSKTLVRAARGCRVAYHLAGSYRGPDDEITRTHVEGTRNLLAALDGGSRVILASSTSVYGWQGPWPADERTPLDPVTAYGRAKRQAEDSVLSWRAGEGIVVRPTIIYGPGDARGMIPRAFHLLRRGMRWFPGDGRNRIHLTYIDDLVDLLIRLGAEGAAGAAGAVGTAGASDHAAVGPGGVYVAAGPEPAPVATILEILAESAGLRRPRFGVPAGLTHAAAGSIEAAWTALSSSEPALTRHSVDVLTRDRAFSSEKAIREVGWQPHVGLCEGMAETVRWLRSLEVTQGRARPKARSGGVPARTHDAGSSMEIAPCPGPPWRDYFSDPDEGLGTVYERFALRTLIDEALEITGSRSILHAPLFGMTGIPGLDCVFQARRGVPVGLLDVDPDRLEAISGLWSRLGLKAETLLAPWPEIGEWPGLVPAGGWDLVFGFATHWWFSDPLALVRAQSLWARKALLLCAVNSNVFMKLRARTWDRDMFRTLNRDGIDVDLLAGEAERAGFRVLRRGFIDLPPFPDTAFPIKKVLGGFGRRAEVSHAEPVRSTAAPVRSTAAPAEPGRSGKGAWTWSILPMLEGKDPDLERRVHRLGFIERHASDWIAARFAHHRYVLLGRD